MRSKNKGIAILTGASTGIGFAAVETLARAGYRVFGTSRRLKGGGPSGVEMVACDVTDQQSVDRLVAHVLAEAGRIDLIVNNAGLGLVGGAEESSLDQVQALFDVNVFGAIRVINTVLPSMRQRRSGRIINISSALGLAPGPYLAHYSATKHALEGYSEALDHELRDFGIRVALIEPAYTRTAMESNALEPDRPLPEYEKLRSKMIALNTEMLTKGDDPSDGGAGDLAGGIRQNASRALPGWQDRQTDKHSAAARALQNVRQKPAQTNGLTGLKPASVTDLRTKGNNPMKAFILDRYGRGKRLRLGEIPQPAIKDTGVLVEIHAAGINPLDYKIRDGEFKLILPFRLPLVMGNDLAGVVVKVGSKVKAFKPGDEVFARPDQLKIGTFAEYIAIDEADLALKPKSLSMVEAASVPLAALTAWQALFEIAKVTKGDRVFIQAGSGGVGVFAIQLAKHAGATVASTASAGNAELVKALGADIVVDYRAQDFAKILSGYDMVLNSQDEGTLAKSIGILKSGGRLVSISGPPDPAFAKKVGANFVVRQVIGLISGKVRKAAKRQGVAYSFLLMRAHGEQLREIAKLIDAGSLRTVVDRVFPFVQTNEALAYVETGRAKGKVVVQIK